MPPSIKSNSFMNFQEFWHTLQLVEELFKGLAQQYLASFCYYDQPV